MHDYAEARDFPAVDGTSRLSAYLRLGVLSVRTCFDQALAQAEREPASRQGVEKWLDELVWREFYAFLRAERPEIARANLRSEYDTLEWNDDPEGFAAWQAGRTGFPIVDAGMRQLAATGWMHNRVRMIVGSVPDQGSADRLAGGRSALLATVCVDDDPASNTGGWQWAASTGTDAEPYFRIFNPGASGRAMGSRRARTSVAGCPSCAASTMTSCIARTRRRTALRPGYPAPIVDHAERRELALARYR